MISRLFHNLSVPLPEELQVRLEQLDAQAKDLAIAYAEFASEAQMLRDEQNAGQPQAPSDTLLQHIQHPIDAIAEKILAHLAETPDLSDRQCAALAGMDLLDAKAVLDLLLDDMQERKASHQD